MAGRLLASALTDKLKRCAKAYTSPKSLATQASHPCTETTAPRMPANDNDTARSRKSTASGRLRNVQEIAPNPNVSANEQRNRTGRFQEASRRGPQKQSRFTVLQYAHGILSFAFHRSGQRGLAAPSVAIGCQAPLCPLRRSTTWVAFSVATN